MKSILAGLVFLAGLGLFAYGCWLAWHPLGFIMGGLVLTAGALFFERGTAVARRRS